MAISIFSWPIVTSWMGKVVLLFGSLSHNIFLLIHLMFISVSYIHLNWHSVFWNYRIGCVKLVRDEGSHWHEERHIKSCPLISVSCVSVCMCICERLMTNLGGVSWHLPGNLDLVGAPPQSASFKLFLMPQTIKKLETKSSPNSYLPSDTLMNAKNVCEQWLIHSTINNR